MVRRKKYLIDLHFQGKFLGYMLFLAVFAACGVTLVLSYLFFTRLGPEVQGEFWSEKYWSILFWSIFIIIVLILVRGFILSHRVVGPVHRLFKINQRIANGDLSSTVEFRHYDELKSLAESYNEMLNGLRSKIVKNNKDIAQIIDGLEYIQKQLTSEPEAIKYPAKNNHEIHKKIEELKKICENINQTFNL